MRTFCLGAYGKITLCVAASAASLFLTGCSEDPGLQEKLTRLQAELQEKNRQIQEIQSALEKSKVELRNAQASPSSRTKPAESAAVTPQFLPKDQVEASYAEASKAMQQRVQGELKDSTIEKCLLYPVVMPTAAYPYNSKISLTVRADSGHSYRLEFPVSADVNGAWTFPEASDINGALAESRQHDQGNTTVSNSTLPPSNKQTPSGPDPRQVASNRQAPTPGAQLVPGQNASETKVFDWGDRKSTPAPRQTPANTNTAPIAPTPPPQATPARQATPSSPQKSMPSDKDVTIHW